MEIKPGVYEVPKMSSLIESQRDRILNFLYNTRMIDDLYPDHSCLQEVFDKIGDDWCTSRGTWPKRLARNLKLKGMQFDNNVISKIGKMAKESVQDTKGFLEINRDIIRMSREEYDSDSCYWGCRSKARNVMERNGVFALIYYLEKSGQKQGRCWCYPVTIEGEVAYALFNAYGYKGLEVVHFARMMHIVFNLPYYRKVELRNLGSSDGLIWINSTMGFMVGTTNVMSVDTVDLKIPSRCSCGKVFYENSSIVEYEGDYYCNDCIRRCNHCGNYYVYNDSSGGYCCPDCAAITETCRVCGHEHSKYVHDWQIVDGAKMCFECYLNFPTCSLCGTRSNNLDSTYHMCSKCLQNHTALCIHCGQRKLKEELTHTYGYYPNYPDTYVDFYNCNSYRDWTPELIEREDACDRASYQNYEMDEIFEERNINEVTA